MNMIANVQSEVKYTAVVWMCCHRTRAVKILVTVMLRTNHYIIRSYHIITRLPV